ncbi:MAG: AAA family ATPase, partial [Bacteroidota bacterium]|nr:AAA family ATPase [Bacteroidota bacterium]
MGKIKKSFFCQNCGAQHVKWQGQCDTCKEWNSLLEEIISTESTQNWNNISQKNNPVQKALKITEIKGVNETMIDSFDKELNRVLGGGIVSGSLILLSGEPGVGKSTLLLQIALKMDLKVLYVSGEESQKQIKLRAE